MTRTAAPRPPTEDEFDFSPSTYHQRLIRRAPLRLSFANAGGEDVAAWQRKLRKKIRELLAIPPNDHGLTRPRTLWRRQTELGVIEKLVFSAEPGADVPAYWCVPHGAQRPYTAFVCLQGHSTGMHRSIGVEREDERKPMTIEGDRDFAIGCMRRGIAALCIEQRSFGYRRERKQKRIAQHSGCHDAVLRAGFLGRTMNGERVFDVDRGLDYLAERGDVDMKRIGILGNSGGGVTTMYAAAVLPRVRYAMPSCCFATFAGSYLSIYHCGCNIVPGAMNWFDAPDAMGAIAPRPLVIINGRHDEIFPIDDARKAFKQVQKIYRAAGAADRVKFIVGPDGHRFYADLGWEQMLKLMAPHERKPRTRA